MCNSINQSINQSKHFRNVQSVPHKEIKMRQKKSKAQKEQGEEKEQRLSDQWSPMGESLRGPLSPE
jgi:hypothetical protein